MIPNILKPARLFLPLILIACAPIEGAAESLPVTVFKNLREGKKQTVITYGTRLTHKGAWTKSLAGYFEKKFPGQVTFLNTARSGMTSEWGVENLQARVLKHRPDLVFIEFSANDAATKHHISTEQSEANLDRMVKELRQQNPQVDIVLQTMNPAWDSPKTPDKKFGSERPDMEAYYDVCRRYAHEHNLPLVDNWPNWLKILKEQPEQYHKMVSDGIHPHSGPSLAVTWPAVEALLEKARAAASIRRKEVSQ